jgi:hypothetical protein
MKFLMSIPTQFIWQKATFPLVLSPNVLPALLCKQNAKHSRNYMHDFKQKFCLFFECRSAWDGDYLEQGELQNNFKPAVGELIFFIKFLLKHKKRGRQCKIP